MLRNLFDENYSERGTWLLLSMRVFTVIVSVLAVARAAVIMAPYLGESVLQTITRPEVSDAVSEMFGVFLGIWILDMVANLLYNAIVQPMTEEIPLESLPRADRMALHRLQRMGDRLKRAHRVTWADQREDVLYDPPPGSDAGAVADYLAARLRKVLGVSGLFGRWRLGLVGPWLLDSGDVLVLRVRSTDGLAADLTQMRRAADELAEWSGGAVDTRLDDRGRLHYLVDL